MSYLTERQKEILEFINEYLRTKGIAPTHREICERFGFSSYGTAYKHLKLLQKKGFLRRDWNQKRGIELLRAIPGGTGLGENDLPLFGRIAAGKPIEAVSGDDHVAVPGHLLSSRGGEHYVLRVVGDSMIGEGVHDGDFVIVLRREIAEPGEMVVALVGDEATLKRFYPEGKMVRLQPANPAMQPIFAAAKDVRVQGIVVGLMRKF
jgi:repressor LexA